MLPLHNSEKLRAVIMAFPREWPFLDRRTNMIGPRRACALADAHRNHKRISIPQSRRMLQ
jgi:hypothetical protein